MELTELHVQEKVHFLMLTFTGSENKIPEIKIAFGKINEENIQM